MSALSAVLKWATFLYEGFLAIPILGGAFVIANGWTPLVIAGVLHAVTIVAMLMNGRAAIAGNAIGLLGAMLSWIPLIGWLFHAVTAFVLFIEVIYLSFTRRAWR
ncbi:MAG: hypothetical protein ACI35R_18085 [Bacillus sp. (in: firmicutes)]